MEVYKQYKNGKEIATTGYTEAIVHQGSSLYSLLRGSVDYSLPNLFDKDLIQAYDSDFADRVFEAIGRKTDSTGCYSGIIPCSEGDWFTRSDFGTGIVVVMDRDGNILGDVKNAAYQPTVQIMASDGQDFTTAAYVSFVVPLASLEAERIVKSKTISDEEGDYVRFPRLRIGRSNLDNDVAYIKGTLGRYYQLYIDDSDPDDIQLKTRQVSAIPESELPADFPFFDLSAGLADYDYLVMGTRGYIFVMNGEGTVKYRKQASAISTYTIKPLVNSKGQRRFGSMESQLLKSGYSLGEFVLFDENFEEIERVTLTDGSKPECHDFCYIDDRHYILMSYLDSEPYNDGQSDYSIIPLRVEEQLDGQRLWVWNSLDHPDLHKDSHVKNGDYLHCNTIALDYDNNLLLNFKQANEFVKIRRTWNEGAQTCEIGEIMYKVGGNATGGDYDNPIRIKVSNMWYEPHDVEYCGMTMVDGTSYPTYTMFDNQGSAPSRILEFCIDYDGKAVKKYDVHIVGDYFGRYQGSVKKISDKRYLVSWGERNSPTPVAGIYDFNDGTKKVTELTFDDPSARAYRIYGFNNIE